MERTGAPLRLLLEACSFTFDTALTITGGAGALVSAPPALREGADDSEDEMSDVGKAVAGARVVDSAGVGEARDRRGGEGAGLGADLETGLGASLGGAGQESREALEANAAAIAAAAAAEKVTTGGGGGSGTGSPRNRELPPSMLEVLKVSLSLMRRLSNRNLATAGPFASTMQMWPPGHPQVRYCFRLLGGWVQLRGEVLGLGRGEEWGAGGGRGGGTHRVVHVCSP